MFGLLDYLKIGAGFAAGFLVAFFPAFALGKYEGRQLERQAVIQRSIEVLRERNAINEEIRSLDDGALCAALGGRFVSDDGSCQ